VASILPALFVGTPVFKCAQALGPFKNPFNKMSAKIFLPKVSKIMSRGAITHEYLMSLGLTNVTAGADYAFSLDITSQEKKTAESSVDMKFFKGRVVGVSPSVVLQKKAEAAGKDYTQTIVTFVDRLVEEGSKVVLLPHSVRSNTTKTHNNDMPLCKEIYERLKDKKNVLFVDNELSSQTLRYVIGHCDYFIASRFHAMVSSLAMEVPTIVIGWSHKYEEVLEMFELEKWAFGQDKLTDKYLWDMYKNIVSENDTVKALLAKNLPSVKKQSIKQADLIAKLIK
jgi:polysaccharide pyruvyl transferase WcaK-like protein